MTAIDPNSKLLESEERVLSTLESDGSRRWLHPRLARGRFLSSHRAVAYLLIAIFTGTPYINLGGKPLILLDVVHRRFTLFGFTFLPTDTVLLALFLVGLILLVFLATALAGRIWCGWACPQTVYMEFVFRPIERLFAGRSGVGGKPRENLAGWRTMAKYTTYLLISLYLAHTFLAYFVGVAALRQWVRGSPTEHLAAFLIVAIVTGLMLFNFGFFREQLCIIACPYGRLQSVLLDRSSVIISYDRRRGDPRGAMRKTALPVLAERRGDCVDCEMCVSVCPTGIDIRDGLQIECIGCAQCIDACDAVMKKVGRATGLIRYSSQAAMAGEKSPLLRPRVVIYPAILMAIVIALTFLLATKSPADVTILRGLGQPFVVAQDGAVENTLRVKMTNRTDHAMTLSFGVVNHPEIVLSASDGSVQLGAGQTSLEPVHVIAPPAAFIAGVLDVTLRISGDDGTKIDRPCRLLGPMKAPSLENPHADR